MTVNAHTHLYSGLMAFREDRTEAHNFREILETLWWRLDRALDERSLRAAARLYVAEAVQLGTEVLIDHHESPNFIEGSLDVLADACQEFGMRALLCYGATERNGGREEAHRGLAECRRFIESNRRPLVKGAVGLHAAFTVSDDTIAEAGALCRELGVPLHVHVAEDACDAGAFARLRRAFVPGSILAHGVHLTWEEVCEADELRLWIVHNPRSNQANGVGYARYLAASSRVALGTDGFPSDLRAEMHALVGTEDADEIERRAEGGELLAKEIWSAEAAPPLSVPNIDDIRNEARAEASRLWERMRGIS